MTTTKKPADSYQWIDLPEGRRETPTWCTGLIIHWADGYGNPPDVTLKCPCDPFVWSDQVWIVERDHYYRAYSPDGRLLQHAHHGRLTWDMERGAWLTTQDEGYGGASFEIVMREGFSLDHCGKQRSNRFDPWESWSQRITFTGEYRKVVLRGPWATTGPDGFVQVACVDMSRGHRPFRRGGRWHETTPHGGLMISEGLYIRLIAKYHSTARMARTRVNGFIGLEPVREDWDQPKHWMQMRDRLARSA